MPAQQNRTPDRMRSYLGAKIFFDHKPSTFDCLVRNISEDGAQISIESVQDIPETFGLYIQKYEKRYLCETKWKTHNKLGVQFNNIAEDKE